MKKSLAVAFVAGIALTLSIAASVAPTLDAPAPEPTVATESLPPCTDAIADAHGMCEGPLVEEDSAAVTETVEETETVTEPVPAPAPSAENTPETWEENTPETQVFEDGSWLAADGTSGCTPGAPCDNLPPVPATAVPSGNGGYLPSMVLPPCHVEDAAYNCYWDATRQGNGQGVSFIVWDGQVYYAN